MEIRIPVRSFAIAADAAAEIFKSNPGSVFCGCRRAASRARTLAVAAMIEVFPRARRATIADGFGLPYEQGALAQMVRKARRNPWWNDEYLRKVVDAISRDYAANAKRSPHIKCDDDGRIELDSDENAERVVREPEPEIVASEYTPRRWTPARIIRVGAARPKNVTGVLLGDPPPGRREQLAAMRSQHYMAGNESGRFRYRGKRILEATE